MNKIELTAALLSDLKENAEKATPGPWVMEIDDFDEDIIKITSLSRQKENKVEIASIPFTENENCSPNEFVKEQRRNADYLHAANPAVVLALIDRIEELEKEVDWLAGICRMFCEDFTYCNACSLYPDSCPKGDEITFRFKKI